METNRLINLAFLIVLIALAGQQWRLSDRIDAIFSALPDLAADPAAIVPAGDSTATATGNSVTIQAMGGLPDGPRTVEQVARYLGVTADTVRESYIPLWIQAGHMSPADRAANRWLIPGGWDPYRPK